MTGLSTPPIKGLSLLFLKVADVSPPSHNHYYPDINGLDIIHAIEKVSGRGTIEGAQRMKNLFRIYCKTKTASEKLSTEGFNFDGRSVTLYTHNPFTVRDQSSETVKIIIGGVPLSVAHDEFEKALLDLNVEMLSDLKFENYRDADGKWTEYKTGRRFVYCKKPTLNLKPYTKIGLWNASIYYRGQVRPKRFDPQTDSDNIHGKPEGQNNANVNTPAWNQAESAEAQMSQFDEVSKNKHADIPVVPNDDNKSKPGKSTDLSGQKVNPPKKKQQGW